MYKMEVQELVKVLLDEDAKDEQKKYLEDTMQPNDMNAIKYAERAEEISRYMKWFFPTATTYSKSYGWKGEFMLSLWLAKDTNSQKLMIASRN